MGKIVSLLCPFFRNMNHPFNKAACSVSGDIIWIPEKECKTVGRVWNVCTWSSKSLKKLLRFWPRLVLLKTVNVFSETQSNREWNNSPVSFKTLVSYWEHEFGPFASFGYEFWVASLNFSLGWGQVCGEGMKKY